MPSFSERWQNVVEICKIDLNQPVNFLATSDIEKYGGKETRLMTSIGSESRLPDIFKKHGVFVIPLSRSKVAIVKGKGFHSLEEIKSPLKTRILM
jgi:hypothetical protein